MTTTFMPRTILMGALLFVLIGILVVELLLLFAKPPSWVLPDYYTLVGWGREAREGTYYFLYPAPVLFWIAVPLSFLPAWFGVVWLAEPFAVLLYRLRENGVITWLFYPLIVWAEFGLLDGLLLLPLFWIFDDAPVLSAISCALLTLKPQLGYLIVPFTLLQWLASKSWDRLLQFGAAFGILYVPTFIIAPTWPLQLLAPMQSRAEELFLPFRGVGLWWWPRDTFWGIASEIVVIVIIAALFLRVMRRGSDRRRAVYLVGLVLMPVLYVISYVTVTATLRNSRREVIAVTLAGFIALLIDSGVGGWGGAYTLVPIIALACLARAGPSQVRSASKMIAPTASV